MTTIIDLSDLADRAFVIQGARKGDWAGDSVASAGDANGDGYSDLIVGAPNRDQGVEKRVGAADIVFGRPNGAYGAIPTRSCLGNVSHIALS